MNVSVPKRWKYSDKKSAFGPGSAQRVPYAVYPLLHEILKTVTSQGPRLNFGSAASFQTKSLRSKGYGSVSRQWVREFMLQRERCRTGSMSFGRVSSSASRRWLTSKGTSDRNSSTYLISGRFHHRAATTVMKLLFAS